MKTKLLTIDQVKPDMVFSRDIYGPNNKLLFRKNSKVTSHSIKRMEFYCINDIEIEDETQIPSLSKPDEKTSGPKASQSNTSGPKGSRYELKDNSYERKGSGYEPEDNTYYERIQASPEFAQFQTQFNQSIANLKSYLDEIASKKKQIDVNKFLEEITNVLSQSRNPLHMFDMLQCIRQFDDLTYVHSMNVALIANVIGKWLNLSEQELITLTAAGALHDIGKLQIPIDIINKPGKLTDQEFNIIRTHPQLGLGILQDQNIDEQIKQATYQHHERNNGTGYPLRIKGDQIAVFSKIIMIADVYDAMTANRVYRKGICPFAVIEQFEYEREFYDPSILYMFLERTVEAYVNTDVLLSNGEQGKVVLLNKTAFSKPIVITSNKTYDLSKIPELTITALL